ncbi:MAG: sulfurtransferase complex subunit TusB [Moraxellaceae bacterium]|nr:sulfurtransferase complex subunit TusB [Moraxellaceae bacterium]
MKILHILSAAPARTDVLTALQRMLGRADAILLTGDGVYLPVQQPATFNVPLFALERDVRARGLSAQWPADVPLIDHPEYVDLCVRYEKSMNWS